MLYFSMLLPVFGMNSRRMVQRFMCHHRSNAVKCFLDKQCLFFAESSTGKYFCPHFTHIVSSAVRKKTDLLQIIKYICHHIFNIGTGDSLSSIRMSRCPSTEQLITDYLYC